MGYICVVLTDNGAPCRAGILGNKDVILAHAGNANKNARTRAAGGARGRIHSNPRYANNITVVPRCVASVRYVGARARKRRYGLPCRTVVGGLEQSVTAACAEIQHTVVVGVDYKALAHSTARHVPS